MMDAWELRVATYLDQLDEQIWEIDQILRSARVNPVRRDPTAVEASTDLLLEQLEQLEQHVAERDQLLRAPDAPSVGLTLTEKLRNSAQRELADRATEIAERIREAHQQSMSLFVCQFHLSNLTSDLVRILTGADYPATYGGPKNVQTTPQGGLFNKSA